MSVKHEFALKQNDRALETILVDEDGFSSMHTRVLIQIAPYTFTESGESPDVCKDEPPEEPSRSIYIPCLSG